MNQAYRDGHGDTNEEQVCPKANGNETLVITKLVVEPVCNCTSKARWESHTGGSNTQRYSPIPDQEPQVHLESDKEKEEDQTNIGRGGECRHGGSREDGRGEAWDAAEDRGA